MCQQLVKDTWEEQNESDVLHKVYKCGEKLEIWGREVTDNFNKRIKECKMLLNKLRRTDAGSIEEYSEVKCYD